MPDTTISQKRLKELEQAESLLCRIEQCIEDAGETMTDGELLDAIYNILP